MGADIDDPPGHARLRRPRGREVDLAIAASALVHHASFWTLNLADFADIPELSLYEAPD